MSTEKENTSLLAPLLIGGVCLAAAIFLWQAMLAKERAHFEAIIDFKMKNVKDRIEEQIKPQSLALVRMANRWAVDGRPSYAEWESDAKLYAEHYPIYQAIEWVDSSARVRWVVPLKGNEEAKDLDLSFEENRRAAMKSALETRSLAVTPIVDLAQGDKGFLVFAPIFINGGFDGFILGVFRIGKLLDIILKEQLHHGISLALFDGGKEVYRKGPGGGNEMRWGHETWVDFYGLDWRLRVWPARELWAEERSFIPEITLAVGFLLAFLLSLTIHLNQKGRFREKHLVNEVAEREKLEYALKYNEKHAQAVIDHMSEGLIIISEKGEIERFNLAAEKMFGYAAGEVIGKNVRLLMPEPDRSRHDEYVRRFLITGKAMIIGLTRELSGLRKNGEVFPLELSLSEAPIKNSRRTFIGAVHDISERKKIEQELRRLSQAVDQSPSSILITDTQARIEYANPSFLATTGYAWEEIAGKNPAILKSGAHPPEFYRELWDTILSGNSWTGDLCNRKKNGELCWETLSISPIKDAQGKITHFVSVKIDDTERKKAEETLRKAEGMFRSIIDNTTTVIYVKDDQGRYLLINRRFEELFGFTNKQIQGKTDYDIFSKEAADQFTANDRQVWEKGSLIEMEEVAPHADGNHTYISIKVPLRDGDGRVYALCGLSTDISERKRIEDTLLQTNRFLKSILDSPSDISIISTDLKGKVLFWSKGAEKMLGYRTEEMIGRKTDILYPDQKSQLATKEAIAFILKHKRGVSGEVQEIRKNGEKIWVKLTLSPKLDETGDVIGILGVGENISQRKAAETALRESEERSRMIIDTASEAFISIDENNLVSDWNKKAEEIFGWSREEALSENVADLIVPDKYLEAHKNGIARFRARKDAPALSRRVEITALHRDGHEFPIELSLSSLSHNGVYIFNAFITDITQRKLAQIEQAHAQKMESIGQLSAGIAHEINTPMQYVGDNIHFLDSCFSDLLKVVNEYDKLLQAGRQGEIPPELIEAVETAAQQADLAYLAEEIPQAIGQSLEGVSRVTKIVGAMKEFSHPGAEEKKLVDINRAVETTVTVAKNEWKYVANAVLDLDPDLPMVPALVNDVHQVVLNLIVNAAHAIADVVGKNEDAKGTIKISTRQNENWVEIRVQDSGTGIPPEIRPKIFDPFFTTKVVGKGTGQGLSLCHAMITKRHNGSISFETEVGQGTTFIVRLPIPPKEPK